MSNDNGTGRQAKVGKPSLINSTVDEYREMLEELDHKWALMTDAERADLEFESKRRRALNPNWPFITSDHSDRLAGRIKENTTAVHILEEAISGPDGMVMRMRASTKAIDMAREAQERHTDMLAASMALQEKLLEAINRWCAALEPRPA